MSTAQCIERMQKGWFDPTAKPVDVAELERARLDAHDAQAMQSGDREQPSAVPNASEASVGAVRVDADVLIVMSEFHFGTFAELYGGGRVECGDGDVESVVACLRGNPNHRRGVGV